ncbi:MAG TPA: ArsR family transcriptional regulator [Methanomicrobia archaeon]|nr:ArsR family transcriptional regulator [Methanomicrobia archaeon]
MDKERIKVIRDPKAIIVGIEKNRRDILKLLRFNDLTVSQIAEILGKDESTIYRHIKKLEEVGLVNVVGERKRYHIPEKIYGRSSNLYIFAMDEKAPEEEMRIKQEYKKKMTENLINQLEKIGYKVKDEERLLNLLMDFFSSLHREWNEKLENKDLEIDMYQKLFTIYLILKAERDEETGKIIKEISEIIE